MTFGDFVLAARALKRALTLSRACPARCAPATSAFLWRTAPILRPLLYRHRMTRVGSIAVGLLLVIAGQNFGTDPTRQPPDKHRGAVKKKQQSRPPIFD